MKRLHWFCLMIVAVSLISYGAFTGASAQNASAMGRGLAELSAGKYSQAVETFQQAIKANPQDAQAHYCLGVSFQYMGRVQEANHEYRWVLKNSKDEALLRRAERGITVIPSSTQPIDPTAAFTNLQVGDSFGAPSVVPVVPRPGTQPTYSAGGSASSAPSPSTAVAGTPKVVDLYTDWCGWCKVLEPLLEQAHVKFGGKVEFTRLNAEHGEGKQVCQQYDVHGYPTVLLFDGSGKLVDRISGCPKSYDILEKRLVKAFPNISQ